MEENNALKAALFIDVAKFNKEIIGMEPPKVLTLLNEEKLNWAIGVLNEEIEEFQDAHAVDQFDLINPVFEACDAMIDLIYYALGRMVEMGVTPLQFVDMWDKVHNANMQKKKGNKGRGSDEDAVKPEDWKAPDFSDISVGGLSIPTNEDLVVHQNKFHQGELGLRPIGPGDNDYGRNKLNYPYKVFVQATTQEELDSYLAKLGYIKEKPEATFTMRDIPLPFQESAELRKKKGEDYRSGGVEMKDYFPFGMQSYFTMINTKVLRLKSLLSSGKEPNNESVRDTLLDLMNYACFNIEAIDSGEV